MIGYLIYDKKDIKRNESYVDWVIGEGKAYDFEIKLVLADDDMSSLILPEFVINRSRHFFVSEYFESKKVPVFNNRSVTEITNNKLDTYRYLKDKQIPLLDTFLLGEKPHFFPCVLKSVDGHGGNEVFLLDNHEEFTMLNIEDAKTYIYQKVAPGLGKDLRVFIIGNKVIECVLRSSNESFKSNYSLGGDISLYKLNTSERQLVSKVINCFDFDYVGIDFLFDENDNLILNEIEDAVGSRMLSELTDINVVSLYLEHIYNTIT